MDNFLDMSFNELMDQYGTLKNNLEKSFEGIKYRIDMTFPACVLRTVECKRDKRVINIMTEGFFEVHYNKINEEYLLYHIILLQLIVIGQVYKVFNSYGMAKYDSEKYNSSI